MVSTLARVFIAALLLLAACGCGSSSSEQASTLHFKSRPDLTPPVVTVNVARPEAAPGFIFIAPKHASPEKGPEIVDEAGEPIWFNPLPGQATDFRVQTYRGQRVLTWWQGPSEAPVPGTGFGHNVIMDEHYQVIATVDAGLGPDTADLHEFKVTQRNTALVTAYRVVPYDLSRFGGLRHGRVADSIVREIDIATGRVLFTWHSLGHVALAESHTPPPKAGGKRANRPWDYFHINSIDEEPNGDLLISARNTWAVYKISRTTGNVLWTLGGKRSTFRLGPGAVFAWQHDARRQGDGTITLFDDQAAPAVGKESRAIRFRLDPARKTATLLASYVAPGGVLAGSQGNAQMLPNGHLLVGWGAIPRITEFDSTGSVVYDATFTRGDDSYRAYRFEWSAGPVTRPAIAVESSGKERIVYASWNGATAVTNWRVVAGKIAEHLRPIGVTSKRAGFETRIAVSTNRSLYAVQALDASGAVLATSAAVPAGGLATG